MSSMIDQNLKISIFGESHSAQIGVVIDNLPAGIPIDMDKVGAFMARRAPKKETCATARREADIPQVVSGPISRSGDLLHQMNRVHRYDCAMVSQGLRQMLWGYFKKMVISENAAAILKLAFSSPGSYNGFQLLVSALLYACLLYTSRCV